MRRGDIYPLERVERAAGEFFSECESGCIARIGIAAITQSRSTSAPFQELKTEDGPTAAGARSASLYAVHQLESGGAVFDYCGARGVWPRRWMAILFVF